MRKELILILMCLCGTASAKSDCVIQVSVNEGNSLATESAARKLQASDPCVLVTGLRARTISSVWRQLWATKKNGGKRMDEEIPDGLPTGNVMLQEGRLVIDFDSIQSQSISHFWLRQDNRVLVNTTSPPRLLVVDINDDAENSQFEWSLQTGSGRVFSEKFTLADQEVTERVRNQFKQIDMATLDETVKMVYKAAVLDHARLYANRDLFFLDLRRHLR